MASTISAGITTTTALSYSADTSGVLQLQTNGGTTALTLDTSQNVGIGVTPSAWSGVTAFQNKSASIAVTSNGNNMDLATNRYNNGTSDLFYQTGNYALMYEQASGSGAHRWFTSTATGTAGNAITFTQAMTLDGSANLTVGAGITNTLTLTGSAYGMLTTTNDLYMQAGGAGNQIIFRRGSTENARIDNSGNLLVGQTTESYSTVGFSVLGSGSGSNNGTVNSCLSVSTNAASSYNLYSTGAGAFRFYVTMDGTIHATSIGITAISDERLKENVRDIDTALSTIMALKPRRYDWKEGKGLDKKNAAGFIAQEFEQVFPDSVGLSKAGEDGIEYKNINYEELIPTLTKAIQELAAQVTTLQTQVTALKG
jgi:hypothetical protein